MDGREVIRALPTANLKKKFHVLLSFQVYVQSVS